MTESEIFGPDGEDDTYEDEAEQYDAFLEQKAIEEQAKQKQEDEEMEKRAFEGKRLCGKDAHAYRPDLDNLQMLSLYREGKSYRQIANAMGCSPSTARNRLKKLLGKVDGE